MKLNIEKAIISDQSGSRFQQHHGIESNSLFIVFFYATQADYFVINALHIWANSS